MKPLILPFSSLGIADVPLAGGKNASLGEMYTRLSAKGLRVPDGFASTTFAYELYLRYNSLQQPLAALMAGLDRREFSNLRETGERARQLILQGKLPVALQDAILQQYHLLSGSSPREVAIRSSATAEDLPEASFAGLHESYLNVQGDAAVLDAIRKCFASLYTDRAIKYREDKGIIHEKVALSVAVQLMVRSDKACSGVAFTLEPESGFRDIILISGVWGLGEMIVQGAVNPDEFYVFKPSLRSHKRALIRKKKGDKQRMMIYDPVEKGKTLEIATPAEQQKQFVLAESELQELANWCLLIEEHYGKPMDVEWAKDGISGNLFIVQARPETVHSRKNPYLLTEFSLQEEGELLATGNAVGNRIAAGRARFLHSVEDGNKLQEGEIVVTERTSPDWDPILKKAAAIITDKGGRTSHASIIARELGVPAVVGCGNAMEKIGDGEMVTVSCAKGETGKIFRGKLRFSTRQLDFTQVPLPEHTEPMLIAGDPDQAFRLSFYPNKGVGLMRMEFIISHFIGVHPMALLYPEKVKDEKVRASLLERTEGYTVPADYFTDNLAQGMATIAAAFYPKDVIVRMSDFKTNEFANLLGGKDFEPAEENPMIGFRGASRYYHEQYRDGFRLECLAVKKLREEMGLTNVKLMIPFCRTVEEARKVIAEMKLNGLDRSQDPGLEFYMMVEIPSNVILAEKFAELFDGFSIGSNDLTQLMLGVDRDSATISGIFNEQNPAVTEMIRSVIQKARQAGVKIGLCGQAPSDFPAFAQFLVECGIDSISFNPDALLKGIENIRKAEERMEQTNGAGKRQLLKIPPQPLTLVHHE